jgi:3',5'-cyclic AMP phosphodiesterase CpdA
VVPGNHDVPLHNLYGRFVRRLDRYQKFIMADMEPFYEDGEIAVMGVNTARSFTIKGGRINVRQVERVRGRFCSLPPGIRKILVAHHPFDVPQSWQRDSIAGRARLVLQVAADCAVDVMLAGHVHRTFCGDAAEQYRIGGHTALVVHAGTATSTRGRGEANAFNVLRIDGCGILVESYRWNAESALFAIAARDAFQDTAEGWLRSAAPTVGQRYDGYRC